MMKLRYLTIAVPLLTVACTTDGAQPPPAGGTPPAMMDQSVPQVARNACLRAVARTTNTAQGVILEMLYSEANSQVTIGVGPDLAKWQCTVSNSGIVANVMSLTNEGAL